MQQEGPPLRHMLVALICLALFVTPVFAQEAAGDQPKGIDSGDTAWLLVSTALVLLMVPGLALFYGGMVRVKSSLNMLMMSFICLSVVTLVWVTYGYSLAFGPDTGWGVIGNLDLVGMAGVGP